MKKSNFNWQFKEVSPIDPIFKAELMNQGYTETFAELLWNRNIHTLEDFSQLLKTTIDDLHDPFLMHDMDKAVERIQTAVMEGQAILVYGDYDADGITSTSIMLETLQMIGADVHYVLPNRFIHGYGPNKELFAEKINEGIQLIITVDNGVAGNEAIDFANSQNVDVIVTDHHELPPILPAAYCIVHPRHPEGHYPFGELAGAGVAFKLATALLEEVPLEMLDLVTIGTVADLVSMTGENRVLVKLGLQAIKQTQRLGLLELLKVSGVALQKADETSIGFSIGPRLNAIGRLGDPNPAVELMTTFDEERAHVLAEKLDQINNQRKQIVQETTAEATALVNPDDAIHLIAAQGWNPGVLGIVAGNILKQTGRPAIVLTIDENGVAKGSGRSVDALDLFGMLTTMRSEFTHFGGHAAAVGLTMPVQNIATLQKKMNEYISVNQIDLTQATTLLVDGVLELSAVQLKFVEELKKLTPFGTDNPAPHFLINGAIDSFKRIGSEQQHVKFSLKDEQAQLDVIGFGFGEEEEKIQQPDTKFVGDLEINEWNGQKKAQLRLIDFASDGLQVIDRRAKYTWDQQIEGGQVLYLAFQLKSQHFFAKKLQQEVTLYTETISWSEYDQLVVLDCPDQKGLLKEISQKGNFERIYLYLYSPDEAYLNGLPSREQFTKLYQFFRKQPRVDIRFKLRIVSNYLKIPEKQIVFMIHVFSELKFVTIDDGVLQMVESPQTRSFEESEIYQKRIARIESEEFLVMNDIQTIRNWLKS
ncbi:single-stranded-DNA-specific exonuclease RecJ [Enterococcus dongliensis]|uniref:Single-stranded-DNA-specific exonuclease RecJ n=1 Tax=Enterococcus dongliensis TaxID=2559925 RepID=A0AAP5KTP9_9ENTE|nr:single-stranded-DNA-specific exonuclease RecJ [Enterococcus dongliensis]MDT2595734.1 single-stranded-DNA-specific exonuclease RecJ [Enterococcus dongliensis]MDT2602694.1 single-stranded-DNA-specific exonuclease RecJ [Enterococcus dongliensis]MDT2633818.1 single-stranded-DNA-specific exonuclease RecJ [Enterococcus dongliensis]MDT2636347.1 single-stranded-DNA-specific exonuclease RecJ [Enterococcus dongliensis]MDT2641568.1 single-stranded-DNA-specific exonuclease RecJ [Enterococcus dongliensi